MGTTTFEFSNQDLNNIMRIVKSLEDAGLLRKDVSKAVQNEEKGENDGFLGMLWGTLGASLFGNLSTDKGVTRAGEGTIRAGKETIRAGQDF